MKFNFLNRNKKVTQNFEGAKAYKMSSEYELYAAVVTSGLGNSFYESENERLKRIKKLVVKCKPDFVAKLAVYTRTEMYMRSTPIVLAVELAKISTGTSLVSKTVKGVVQRADEITELLAYYQIANRRKDTKKLNRLSKQVQKGLAAAFNNFDEYQFAKYNRATEVKLKDALFLVHPKAKSDEQQELFNKIAKDTLATPFTWETELSALGKNQFFNENEKNSAFKNKWESLIESKKLGYMALMRNLRNILEVNVSSKHIEMVCSFLSNEKAVLNSKQLPFRYLAAYREIKSVDSKYTSEILDALEIAVMQSAKNIKGFGYDTSVVIACDVSGSMQKPISRNSKILLYDVGLMLGMLLQSQCKNVISGMFGDRWKTINMPKRSVLSNVNEYYKREGEVGYATNGYKIIEKLISNREVVDKVMIFTDVQMWNSQYKSDNTFEKAWLKYKTLAPQAKLYLFDLSGYGKQAINIERNDVYMIAGWSDKVFDMLDAVENSNSVIKQIEAMVI